MHRRSDCRGYFDDSVSHATAGRAGRRGLLTWEWQRDRIGGLVSVLLVLVGHFAWCVGEGGVLFTTENGGRLAGESVRVDSRLRRDEGEKVFVEADVDGEGFGSGSTVNFRLLLVSAAPMSLMDLFGRKQHHPLQHSPAGCSMLALAMEQGKLTYRGLPRSASTGSVLCLDRLVALAMTCDHSESV